MKVVDFELDIPSCDRLQTIRHEGLLRGGADLMFDDDRGIHIDLEMHQGKLCSGDIFYTNGHFKEDDLAGQIAHGSTALTYLWDYLEKNGYKSIIQRIPPQC